jgi:hypothetical protein
MRALAPEVLFQVKNNSRRRARLQPCRKLLLLTRASAPEVRLSCPIPNFSATCLDELRFSRPMGQSHAFSRLSLADQRTNLILCNRALSKAINKLNRQKANCFANLDSLDGNLAQRHLSVGASPIIRPMTTSDGIYVLYKDVPLRRYRPDCRAEGRKPLPPPVHCRNHGG